MTQPTDQSTGLVRLGEVMQLATPGTLARMTVPLFLGKDSYGEPLVADLATMPHCLIAGVAGSGKSACINAMLMSILHTQSPADVQVILIDPRIEERPPFGQLPHLLCPVITTAEAAAEAIGRVYGMAHDRHLFITSTESRNIAGYNRMRHEERRERLKATTREQQARVPMHLPRIVIIIEELTDTLLTFDDADEAIFSLIGQLLLHGRMAGIHVILATQRPQAVSPELKARFPCRIALLDVGGAEMLKSPGDMLFLTSGVDEPVRARGSFVTGGEISDAIGQAMNRT